MRSKTKPALLIAAAVVSFAFTGSDTCSIYAPSKPGTQLEYKHYSAKDKQEGSTRMTVLDAVMEGNSAHVKVQSEVFDRKGNPAGTSTLDLKCEDGMFFIDMQNMVGSEQKTAFKDMKLDIQADRLEIPADPKPGDQLKDGALQMRGSQEGSPLNYNLTMKITNRKVEAIEDVTVPAGVFKAVKITYDAETKFMFTVRSKAAEWYAKDIGIVRSETYDKNGKLQSYMVLTSSK